jgi:hypothetical protein
MDKTMLLVGFIIGQLSDSSQEWLQMSMAILLDLI